MSKLAKMSMLVAAALFLSNIASGPLSAQSDLSLQKKAQNKLMAERAARADAMRKIAERIRGLHITSSTLVKDFVAESDQIQASMTAFLSGMTEVGKPKHLEDGTCEVVLEVPLETVIVSLKEWHDRYYKGGKFKGTDFEKMTVTNEIKMIREVGQGAQKEDETIPCEPDGRFDASKIPAKAMAFWKAHVTGRGRLMAERAARVEGMRRLAERIRGVMITSDTNVQDFVAQSDQIDVNMETFLQGARQTGVRYHDDELIVEVNMEVTLRTVYASLQAWGDVHYKGNKVKMTEFEKLEVTSKDTIVKETGMGVPPEQYLKDVTAEMTASMSLAAKAPDWVGVTKRAVGNAAMDAENENKAQAKLMAYRAAELDARRKLAEEINGLMISSNTSVQDFVAQNDQIQTDMMAFQAGAHVMDGSQKLLPDGTAQVTVEMDLRPLWDDILVWQKKFNLTIK
jgi:hypothetical protein